MTTVEKLQIELKDLIAQGKPGEVFRRLKDEILQGNSELYNDTVIIASKFSGSERAGNLGLIDFKEKSIQFNNVSHALTWLIDRIAEADIKPSLRARKTAGGLHALTCDRNEQFDAFEEIKPAFQPGSLHFFYLYGGEMQAHKSFFQRIYLDLKGKFAGQSDRPVAAIDFVVEDCRNPELLRGRLLRNFCTALGLNPADYSPLTHQNLSDLLLRAEKTRDLRKGSYLCVFVHISHWYWNRQLTPEVARWFITQFCPAQLPPDSPSILFFFAFDFNEDENPGVRDDVLEAVNTQAERVQPFAELDMVTKRDVAQWLVRYGQYFPPVDRQQILQKLAPEYYMADLEPLLQKLIDDYFNDQTYEY